MTVHTNNKGPVQKAAKSVFHPFLFLSKFVLNTLCNLLVNNTVLANEACFHTYYPNLR